MKVEIYLKETSQRIKFDDVKNAYTKGKFYCVYTQDDWVYKYPIESIFNVRESYK
jgi:hypothetical protein